MKITKSPQKSIKSRPIRYSYLAMMVLGGWLSLAKFEAAAAILPWAGGETDFVNNHIQSGNFHPVFVDDPDLANPSYGPGGSGNWAFTVSAVSTAVTVPVNNLGNGGVGLTPVADQQSLTITFTGNLPTAVGGNFFRSSSSFPANLLTGSIRVTVSDGVNSSFQDLSSTAPSTFGFVGFTTDGSGFNTLTLSFPTAPGSGIWATVGNLYVGANPVPETGGWLAASFIGLIVLGRCAYGLIGRVRDNVV